jgi:hypothetical protein
VGGDLQLHLLENSELAAAGTDHRLSIADPHFALWINDVLSLVEDLRGKGLEVLENRPSGAPFQQAFVKDSDGNMVEFIGPGISWTNYVCISVERPKGVALAPLWRSHGCDRGRRSRWRCLMNWLT